VALNQLVAIFSVALAAVRAQMLSNVFCNALLRRYPVSVVKLFIFCSSV